MTLFTRTGGATTCCTAINADAGRFFVRRRAAALRHRWPGFGRTQRQLLEGLRQGDIPGAGLLGRRPLLRPFRLLPRVARARPAKASPAKLSRTCCIVGRNNEPRVEVRTAHASDTYDSDYEAWARHQACLLRAGRFAELDLPHLIEELEDMGRSERNELECRLAILLAHLLKGQFQYRRLSERRRKFKGDSWRLTIIEQRDRIAKRLAKSPRLRSRLDALLEEAYADATCLAAKETGLAPDRFPPRCPYTQEQLLDDRFFPRPGQDGP